jgi:hypothetical protein
VSCVGSARRSGRRRQLRVLLSPTQLSQFLFCDDVNGTGQEITWRTRFAGHTHSHSSQSYGSMAPFDLDACIQQLLHKQLLHEALLREICEKTKEVLMRESNVVHVSAPVTVVGDIHGCALPPSHHFRLVTLNHFSSQFYDLIEIFRIGGYAPYTNYLFLGAPCPWPSHSLKRRFLTLLCASGDYVDRGLFSVETISLLTCLKLRYPDRVQLIRGNHESRAVTQVRLCHLTCNTPCPSSCMVPDIRVLHGMRPKIRIVARLDVFYRHV